MNKNTIPEEFDGGTKEQTLSQEELLMNENELLHALVELSRTKDNAENFRQIKIMRNGQPKLTFRIRPVYEDENQECLRAATKYATARTGQPKRTLNTDLAQYRSYLIYTATVDEDRAKLWDNKQAQEALDILQGVDMIDRVLLAGEKSRVLNAIDEISGYKQEAEELAKN